MIFHSVVERSLQFTLDRGGALFCAGWISCRREAQESVDSWVLQAKARAYVRTVATASAEVTMGATGQQSRDLPRQYRRITTNSKKIIKPQIFNATSRFIEFLPGGSAGSSGGMVSGSDVSVCKPSF